LYGRLFRKVRKFVHQKRAEPIDEVKTGLGERLVETTGPEVKVRVVPPPNARDKTGLSATAPRARRYRICETELQGASRANDRQ
jgi:hypothetical protein